MKYNLVGINGNAYSIVGYTIRSMKECKFSTQEIDDYKQKAFSSNYDNLLSVSVKMIDKCNEIYYSSNLDEDEYYF